MNFITNYKPNDIVYIVGYLKKIIKCKVLDIHIWLPYRSTCMVSYVVEDEEGNKYTVSEDDIYTLPKENVC